MPATPQPVPSVVDDLMEDGRAVPKRVWSLPTFPLLRALIAAVIVMAASCAPSPEGQSSPESWSTPERFALVGVTVIDGTGAPPVAGRTVIVEGIRIAAVVEDGAADLTGATVIPAKDKYLIPALWDAHAHTDDRPEILDLYLANGIGSLRDMGCAPDCAASLIEYRRRRGQVLARGPYVLVSGPNADGRSPFAGYAGHVRVTVESAAAVVGDLEAMGSDFVKVRDWLSHAEYIAVSEAARAARLPVDGHVATDVPMLDALRAGQRTIEHSGSVLGGLLLACSSREEELRAELRRVMAHSLDAVQGYAAFVHALKAPYLDRLHGSFDEVKAEALVDEFVASGTALAPTLVVQHPAFQGADPRFDGRRLLDEESIRFVPEAMLAEWRADEAGALFDERDRDAQAENYQRFVELVGRLHRAGVPILAGTDAALLGETSWLVPGFSLHDELLLLVEAGLTPLEAIASATSVPARVLGLHDVGTIEVGKQADLILLSADPSIDIRNTRRIEAVVSRGELLDRATLNAQLDNARAALQAGDARE